MSVRGASKRIVDTLLTWKGIEVHPHCFGGTEFRIGKREIGHIHGDSLVDIPFPKKIRDEIVAKGEASPHHILSETGWISFFLERRRGYKKGERFAQSLVPNCVETECEIMTSNIRVVNFDMDGVLTDSELLINEAAIAMFKEKGLTVQPDDFPPFVGAGEERYLGEVAEIYNFPLEPV